MTHWTKLSFVVESIKIVFLLSVWVCHSVSRDALQLQWRDGRLLKLPLHGRHQAEVRQYVLCIAYNGLQKENLFHPFCLISPPLTLVLIAPQFSGVLTCEPPSPLQDRASLSNRSQHASMWDREGHAEWSLRTGVLVFHLPFRKCCEIK